MRTIHAITVARADKDEDVDIIVSIDDGHVTMRIGDRSMPVTLEEGDIADLSRVLGIAGNEVRS